MANPTVDLKPSPEEETFPESGAEPEERLFRPMTWEAPEFAWREKSTLWFVVLFVVTSVLVLIMVVVQNYTAAILFVLSAFLVYLYGTKQPRVIQFGIEHGGVRVGGRLYLYEDLRSFWIFYDKQADRAELSLRSKRPVMPYIRLPLGSVNPAKVHAALRMFLPERRHADSIIDEAARRTGY